MNNFKKRLCKTYPFYILGLAGSIAVSCFAVDLIVKPRNEETFLFFSSSYSYNSDLLKTELTKNMPSYLRELNVNAYYVKDSYFDNYFSTVGLLSSDILICAKSIMTEELATRYFTALDPIYVSTLLGDVDYITFGQDNTPYGVRIHEKGKQEDSKHLITYYLDEKDDEDYYAFYRNGSLHLGELSSTKWTTSFDYTKVILNYVWKE